MQQPLVSVVILNWNGRKFLEQFLPSVLASTYANKKIIVADNASTDDSILFLQQNFPSVEIIKNPGNEGFAKGYNTALRQIKSDYYVLLNSDVEVTPSWIEPVITLMETDALIVACQPKILSYSNKHQFEYAGACGGWMDNFGYPFSRGRVFDAVEDDNGQYDDVQQCFWASGAALFVKAAIYHEVKGLDEYMFAHQEEIDFCWRVQLAGYKVYVQPAAIVYHVGGGTLPHGNSRKVFLNFRNNLIMLAKNFPLGTALWKIPFRIKLDALAALKALLSGDTGYFTMIIKAHLHFIKWLFTGRKQSVFPVSKKGKIAGWYGGSIVWQYFIKKKSSFSKIVADK
ncbi:MAG TPA: glycosyltransferase family 2 protein [Ferruginibacter sp.]|jgi:GT2 family glycosyltransferase|nr:glycosyltransferase family 2 protein [Ferruginibacter sp.]